VKARGVKPEIDFGKGLLFLLLVMVLVLVVLIVLLV
jgi:hypothetical protein